MAMCVPSPGASSPASTASADERASPNPLSKLGASLALLEAPPASPAASISPVVGSPSPLAADGGVSSLAAPELADKPEASNGDVPTLAEPELAAKSQALDGVAPSLVEPELADKHQASDGDSLSSAASGPALVNSASGISFASAVPELAAKPAGKGGGGQVDGDEGDAGGGAGRAAVDPQAKKARRGGAESAGKAGGEQADLAASAPKTSKSGRQTIGASSSAGAKGRRAKSAPVASTPAAAGVTHPVGSAAPVQPKRPPGGAFGQFMNEKRKEFMEKCKGKPVSEVCKMAGAEWKKLSKEQQAPYQQKFEAAQKKYNEEMAAFLAAGGVQQKVKAKAKPKVKAKAKAKDKGNGNGKGESAAVADKNGHLRGGNRAGSGRTRGQRSLAALDRKYPWGREGPPPASEAEKQSLAVQMARLRKDVGNFGRPDRTDAERLAHAQAMLHIMRDKALASFGGGQAMATHGLNLTRSSGLAIAKRAMKLALDLEAHFDPEAAPSVLIAEGIALLDAD